MEAFEEIMSAEMDHHRDENIKKLLYTARIMKEEYDFYVPPICKGMDEMQDEYEKLFLKTAKKSRDAYLELLKENNPDMAYNIATKDIYHCFIIELDGIK